MSRRNFGRIGKSITPETKLTITPKMGIVGLNDLAYNSLAYYPVSATGGTVTIDGLYKVHTFTSSGTFTITTAGYIEAIVVAGGGGGASNNYVGAGGGGGEVIYHTQTADLADYNISIGAGGGGSSANGTNGGIGGTTTFGNISATGGNITGGANGNSSGNLNPPGDSTGDDYLARGAGGAGGAGVLSTGGVGLLVTSGFFAGNTIYYGAGGGGGSAAGRGATLPGSVGAGYSTGTSAVPALSNTGGGGGGGSRLAVYASSAGGSGIVIIRYLYQ